MRMVSNGFGTSTVGDTCHMFREPTPFAKLSLGLLFSEKRRIGILGSIRLVVNYQFFFTEYSKQ